MKDYPPFQAVLGKWTTNSIDPIYKMALNRKNVEHEQPIAPELIHSREDIEELENFCRMHGIIGVNFKHSSPKAVLSLLKKKLGIIDNINNQYSKMNKNLLLD